MHPHLELLLLLAALWLTACVPAEQPQPQNPNNTQQTPGLPPGCDTGALAATCPPGSQPLTGTDAFDACQGRSDVQLTDTTGAISGICQGQGACLVVCNLQDPCQCGIERIDDQGIFCVPCQLSSACGNALCEGGEDPATCPVDCAAQCTPGYGRCQGNDLEICQDNGSWASTACRADQKCVPGDTPLTTNRAYCQTALSPSGGTVPTITPPPNTNSDTRQLRVYKQTLCARNECLPIGFLNNDKILAHGLSEIDLNTGESDLLGIGNNINFGNNAPVDMEDGYIAWCDDRTIQVLNTATGSLQSMKALVDQSIPLECGQVTLTEDANTVAATLTLDSVPMVAVWNTDNGDIKRLLRFEDPDLGRTVANNMALSQDGNWMVECRSLSQGPGLLLVWNLGEGRYTSLLQLEGCQDMVIRPGAYQVLIGATLWDLATGQAIWSLQQASGSTVAASPDGQVFMVGTDLVEADSGLILSSFTANTSTTSDFSDDGSLMLLGYDVYQSDF